MFSVLDNYASFKLSWLRTATSHLVFATIACTRLIIMDKCQMDACVVTTARNCEIRLKDIIHHYQLLLLKPLASAWIIQLSQVSCHINMYHFKGRHTV